MNILDHTGPLCIKLGKICAILIVVSICANLSQIRVIGVQIVQVWHDSTLVWLLFPHMRQQLFHVSLLFTIGVYLRQDIFKPLCWVHSSSFAGSKQRVDHCSSYCSIWVTTEEIVFPPYCQGTDCIFNKVVVYSGVTVGTPKWKTVYF